MKKLIILSIIMYFIINFKMGFALGVLPSANVSINGSRVKTDVSPIILYDRVYVPLNGVFDKLGAQLSWNNDNRSINIKNSTKSMVLFVDKKIMSINGIEKPANMLPIIVNDRAMLPLGFVSENFGLKAAWIDEAKLAAITTAGFAENDFTKTILGFASNDLGIKSLKNNRSINTVAVFSYTFNGNGQIFSNGAMQNKIVKYANDNNIKPLVVITNCDNNGFNRYLANAVLSNNKKRQNLINSIFNVVSKEGYSGVNIDIENVNWSDRQYYTLFIKELKEKLSPYGFLTTICVTSKTYDSYKGDNWGGAFDYSELNKYADKIFIMTYDQHYIGSSDAGPIASYSWVLNVLNYATKNISKNKILIGIAAYGYDWSSEGNNVLIYKNIASKMKSFSANQYWDEASKSPYFLYSNNGITHQLWYENEESMKIKAQLIKTYNLGGFGVWKLGFENNNVWDIIQSQIN